MTQTGSRTPGAAPPLSAHEAFLQDVESSLDKLTFGAGVPTRRPHHHGEPRFHTILACVDAGPEAENVLAWAREIATAHEARVVVASVVPPMVPAGGLGLPYGVAVGIEEAYADADTQTRARAEESARRLRAAGIEADAVVASGGIARALAEVAGTHHADLVIVGSHGGGPLVRMALGSTGDLILDRVEGNVLVARTAPPHRRILAATDGSSSSYRAVAYALRQADLAKAELVVQHVLDLPDRDAGPPSAGFLRDVIARMQLAHHPRVSYRLDWGRPAERILALAEETDADLIVVGSRGLGSLRGLLLGSVSHRLVNASRTSVLVVKEA